MNSSLIRTTAVPGLALAGALLAAAVPAAHADDYTVPYCRDEAGNGRPLQDWFPINNRGHSADSATQSCANSADVMTVDWVANASRPALARTGWRLEAKNGNSIVGWSASASAVVNSTMTSASLSGVASCNSWQGCTNDSFGGAVAMNTDALEFSIFCANGVGSTCDGTASARLWKNVVTFRDPNPPISKGVSGPLLSSTPGNPISGTVEVAAAAQDTGSGVRNFSLQVDGKEVAKTLDACQAPYDRQVPCPVTGDGTMRLDTTSLADGTHSALVSAVDASGSTTVLWEGQIIVGNSPTRGPGSDVNVRGAQNGSHGGDDATITAWWPATAQRPSSNKAVQQRCKKASYRRRNTVRCNGRSAGQKLVVPFSGVRNNVLRGRIQTSAGAPIAGATLQLVGIPRAAGAAPTVVATPVTDADGRFVAKLPVATGSATYAINWFARARDTTPAATGGVRRTVRSATTLRITPRRAVRRGRILTFTGTLRGTNGVREGNAVLVEANPGKVWRAVSTTRANAQGQWTIRYRVPRQLRGSYRFRAVVTPSAAYPYSLSATPSRRVRVR